MNRHIILVSSGDSWEREFDEPDLVQPKADINPLTKSEETITPESLSSSTITTITAPTPLALSSSSSNKKGEHEFDDEWEAWS
jgi:hypothetical protein